MCVCVHARARARVCVCVCVHVQYVIVSALYVCMNTYVCVHRMLKLGSFSARILKE